MAATDCRHGPRDIPGRPPSPVVPVGDIDALALAMEAALAEAPDPEKLGPRRWTSPLSGRRQYLSALGVGHAGQPRLDFVVIGAFSAEQPRSSSSCGTPRYLLAAGGDPVLRLQSAQRLWAGDWTPT